MGGYKKIEHEIESPITHYPLPITMNIFASSMFHILFNKLERKSCLMLN